MSGVCHWKARGGARAVIADMGLGLGMGAVARSEDTQSQISSQPISQHVLCCTNHVLAGLLLFK